jgi:glycosyltransferase involved in cell wall biosynthesis
MSKIILVNDYLHGLMGERVLWDFMLEGIPNLIKVDLQVLKTCPEINNLHIPFSQKVSLYIEKYHSDYKAIIQNGSYFGLIPSKKPRIAIIQDNLRKMGRRSRIQEYNFKNAEYIVTNSNEVDKYYNERSSFQITLGVDNKLFTVLNKNELRKKYNIDSTWKKIGIFVGAMNSVKGWSRILNIIDTHKDIYWIVVSKHNENLKRDNIAVYNKIDQNKLCELYNCADFFIIGSPSETQCLAAIEACLCNIPIIMRNTGFVTNLTAEEKKQIGFVGGNLEEYVEMIKYQTFIPREIVMKYYSIDDMCKKWIKFLNTI